jgi:hypothetical protein
LIKVNFDPANLPGSLLIQLEEFKPVGLAVKLRDAGDPRVRYLQESLSAETRLALQTFDAAQALPDSLRDRLVADLNRVLSDAPLFTRKLFKGMEWRKEKERNDLMTLLAKHGKELISDLNQPTVEPAKKVAGLSSFNRLLIEEIFPDEIVMSRQAEWGGWGLLAGFGQKDVIKQWEQWKRQRRDWKKSKVGPEPKFDPVFKEDVWRGFRNWLKVHVFNFKCAYCESKITAYPGDTEHFRPKNRVRRRFKLDDPSSEIVSVIDEDGEQIPHPGYFWLAYHWQNLLPSCEFCNTGGGKLDVFQVERAHFSVTRLTTKQINDLLYRITQSPTDPQVYFLEPGDLDQLEGRLLLHPYFDDPEAHIYFECDGTAAAWENSERGAWSIRVFDLDEGSKLKERRREQHDARRRYVNLLNALDDDDMGEPVKLKEAAREFMRDYYAGERPYAAAVFDYIHYYLGKESRLDPVRLLGPRRKKNATP